MKTDTEFDSVQKQALFEFEEAVKDDAQLVIGYNRQVMNKRVLWAKFKRLDEMGMINALTPRELYAAKQADAWLTNQGIT